MHLSKAAERNMGSQEGRRLDFKDSFNVMQKDCIHSNHDYSKIDEMKKD